MGREGEGEERRLCLLTSTHSGCPSLCSSPGMASHLPITESAVLCTWSSGTTLSTMPTWRASAGGKSNPSCRARSAARCPMVFTSVSLNLECRHPLTWGWGLPGGLVHPWAKWKMGAVPGLTRKGRRCPAGSHSAQWHIWDCQPGSGSHSKGRSGSRQQGWLPAGEARPLGSGCCYCWSQ